MVTTVVIVLVVLVVVRCSGLALTAVTILADVVAVIAVSVPV